jgi:hypothetical protein
MRPFATRLLANFAPYAPKHLKAEFHEAFERAGTDVEQIDGQRLVERTGSAFAAYEEVLVCEDCNNADTEAKKQITAPRFFSFSIGQILSFIRSGDHQPHQVDASRAKSDSTSTATPAVADGPLQPESVITATRS